MGAHKNARCSKCGSSLVRWSRTRIWERPIRLIQVRPFRCNGCGRRFYASISYGQATVQDQAASPSKREFSSEVSSASAGGLRIASGKWILVYGLLACCFIGAIASLRFGTKLPHWPARGDKSSLVNRASEAQNESVPSKISTFKPAMAHPSSKSVDTAATARSSVRNIEPRGHYSARQEGNGVSSAAVAIRAERPKLPANLESTIATDNIVEVQVQIDYSGKVISATTVSAKGPVATSLANYALESARRWRFRPARKNGKPVTSDRVLEFLFRASDSSSGTSNESR